MKTPTEALEPVMDAMHHLLQDGEPALTAAIVALVIGELEALECEVGDAGCVEANDPEPCDRCQRLAAWRAM